MVIKCYVVLLSGCESPEPPQARRLQGDHRSLRGGGAVWGPRGQASVQDQSRQR